MAIYFKKFGTFVKKDKIMLKIIDRSF